MSLVVKITVGVKKHEFINSNFIHNILQIIFIGCIYEQRKWSVEHKTKSKAK